MVKIHKAACRPTSDLRPEPANPRTHSKKQISQIAESFKRFGFLNPIIVDERGQVIAGHGRLAAAERLGLELVSVIVVSGLSPSDKKRLMLADNKIAQNAGWDTKALAAIFEDLVVEDVEIEVTGFETGEIDAILDAVDEGSDEADDLDAAAGPPVCQRGDEWRLGDHRLVCGDALCADTVARIGNGLKASAAFLDPPYNVEVRKIVGRGKRKHAEFAMGSGEMSREQFAAFLKASFTSVVRMLRPGAVAYVCIDWRSVDLVVEIGRKVFGTHLNIAVWVKPNAGQGSFYRSQHELVVIFRAGDAPHRNNVQLGRFGRNRSNVWHYAGINSFKAGPLDDLTVHPTVKPVALVADALKDTTRRGDHVVDVFGGSGTTLLAAERAGRKALMIEIEPRYVDVTIRRWQAMTGRDAVHVQTGATFDELARSRRAA